MPASIEERIGHYRRGGFIYPSGMVGSARCSRDGDRSRDSVPQPRRYPGRQVEGVSRSARGPSDRLGIRDIEVAEELVEPVYGRQEFVAGAEMVLADLAGSIAVLTVGLSLLGQRLPTRLTGPPRFIGVPGRTASRAAA